ncbi:MAG: molecular chaperone HtpG [Oscillospiraceae bacterium]|nr:molecular chaperone HtpG [Oscillospiraceae bacterium]
MAKKQFKAESKRLLDLMINSIYTNKEIFLREIISNASDAIDKLCYLSLTDENVGLSRGDYRIDVIPDKEARTITVRDNGIGMSLEEAEKNLGVIAKSGSLSFKGEMDQSQAGSEDLSIIGQFGVGFYSAFMVSDKVTVLTRKYGEEKGVQWESTGADGYTVTEIDRDTVGTDVIMHIKPDSDEEIYGSYLEIWKLKALIKKYSDYVRWPIMMEVERRESYETGEKNDDGSPKYDYRVVKEEETVNSMIPIWQRSKSEVTDDDCIAWYKERYHDVKDPCALVRINAEGAVSYKAMLFVPGEENGSQFYGETKGGITLYSNGVMIMENCDKLVHDYFEFVKGVVDSPDLSLNISREILQHDRQLRIMGQNVEKRIKGELEKLMREDRPKYEAFYKNFGIHLKCGVCDEYGRYKDFLRDLLIFYTSEDHQLTLKEYAEAMPESQKVIYYASSDSVKHAIALPQCEEVRRRGYEIIYLDTPIDEMVLEALHDQDGKAFCNVVTDDLGFETEEEKKAAEERDIENKELLDFVKESIGDDVAKVRLSRKLASQPCCLTTEGGLTLEMEKYFRRGPSEEMRKVRASRVLELNPEHRAYTALKAAFDGGDTDRAKSLSLILARMAEMLSGAEIEDPTAFVTLVAELF